jgi:DNA-binding CsgD family transcriptional regulator
MRMLPRIVSADIVAFDELRGRDVVRQLVAPEEADFPESGAAMARYLHQHPIVTHIRRTGDIRPTKLSDFLTQPQLRKLALYNELFRKIDIEHLTAFSLNTGRRHMVGMALGRPRNDFNEDERQLLKLLQPHLLQSWRNAQAATRLLGKLKALDYVAEHAEEGAALANADGSLEWCNQTARRLLAAYFEKYDGQLAEELCGWVQQEAAKLAGRNDLPAPARPYAKRRGRSALVVRIVPSDSRYLLILNEHRSALTSPTPNDRLTARENEILHWVALGKTNAEAAAILGLSALTVKKHLEHIYAKLGVVSRTAAAARAGMSSAGTIDSTPSDKFYAQSDGL